MPCLKQMGVEERHPSANVTLIRVARLRRDVDLDSSQVIRNLYPPFGLLPGLTRIPVRSLQTHILAGDVNRTGIPWLLEQLCAESIGHDPNRGGFKPPINPHRLYHDSFIFSGDRIQRTLIYSAARLYI